MTLTLKEASEKLKPCPFCGEFPIITATQFVVSGKLSESDYHVYCANGRCAIKPRLDVVYTKVLEALSAWNKRS